MPHRLSTKHMTKSVENIGPPKLRKSKRTSDVSPSAEMTEDINFEDLLVKTYSSDLKLESETTKMIFKDISEHELNGGGCVGENRPDQLSETRSCATINSVSSCKSVSLLNACQVLRLSDTSYCIRLAKKRKNMPDK